MNKKSALFQIGEQVCLKSGGPPMTVVRLPVDLPDLPGEYDCTWFEGKRHHQKRFPAAALEAAPNSATGINVSELLDAVQAIRDFRAKQDAASKPKSH